MKTYSFIHVLRTPWAILIGILAGICIGLLFPHITPLLAPFGTLYLRFLEMCILPIIITAVVSSIGKLLKSPGTKRYLKKLIFSIVGGLLFAGILGISFALIGSPGKNLSIESKIGLGKIISKYQDGQILEIVPEAIISVKEEAKKEKESLFFFISKLVPHNFFQALTNGENIQVLFFSVIFGIALGFLPKSSGEQITSFISGIFVALEEIIFFALYLLPFALVCILANQIAETGITVLKILGKYVMQYFVIITLMFCVNIALISRMLKITPLKALSTFKEAMLITFGATNVYIGMPAAMRAMHEKLKLDYHTVKLVLPIGVSIFGFGSTCFYAFNTIFFAQLFEISLSFQDFFIVGIGAIIASTGTVGSPALIKIAMISVLLVPLKIPLAPAIIILTAIKPITETIEEVWDLYTNCVLTTFVAKKQTQP